MLNEDSYISVVVPAFNVEEYISDCLHSLCAQSDQYFELVLVNDGSTDGTIATAEEILDGAKFNHQIISKQNGGLSSARNAGIDASSGKWILFLDSDDTIHPKTIECLRRLISLNSCADSLIFNYQTFFNESNNSNIECLKQRVMSAAEFAELFYRRQISFLVCTILFSKDLFLTTNLRFDEDCKFSEDQCFIWLFLSYIQNLVYIDCQFYNYRQRPGSVMHSFNLESIVHGYESLCKVICGLGASNFPQIVSFDLANISSRWVFGALHSMAKIISFSDFCILMQALKYDQIHRRALVQFPDFRIRLLAILSFLSDRLFYLLLRRL